MAGHILVKTQEDFDSADYDYCTERLEQRLYRKQDMDLTRFL